MASQESSRQKRKPQPMSDTSDETDILEDLKEWLEQLVADKPHRERAGEQPGAEIDLVNRAIEEIERLRGALAGPPQRWPQTLGFSEYREIKRPRWWNRLCDLFSWLCCALSRRRLALASITIGTTYLGSQAPIRLDFGRP
jgi:hypothetical protein